MEVPALRRCYLDLNHVNSTANRESVCGLHQMKRLPVVQDLYSHAINSCLTGTSLDSGPSTLVTARLLNLNLYSIRASHSHCYVLVRFFALASMKMVDEVVVRDTKKVDPPKADFYSPSTWRLGKYASFGPQYTLPCV